MFPIFFVFFPLCLVQKVKSVLQHVVLASWRNGLVQKVKSALQYVVLGPWRSGPVGTFS